MSGSSRVGRGARERLHLLSSTGGHLELLVAIEESLGAYERVWVTPESKRAHAIADRSERVEWISYFGRNPFRLVGHLGRVIRLVRAERPSTVICTGAGPTVPFCLVAWLHGAKLIFIETMARVKGPSITGRILSRFASVVIVQWPEMLRAYRCARLCQPALLSSVARGGSREGAGTFVAVGTHVQPFDRLLAAVDRAVQVGVLPGAATGQCGTSGYSARAVALRDFMSPEEIGLAIRRARYVVCHAGSGIISAALSAGRRPLVMARRRAHREHVDDHQLQLVEKLGEMDLVVPVESEITAAHLAAADAPLDPAVLHASLSAPTLPDAVVETVEALRGGSAGAPDALDVSEPVAPRASPAEAAS